MKPKWINVKDKLPPDDNLVLAWHSGFGDYVFAFYRDNTLPFDMPDNGWDSKNEITHWSYLPKDMPETE